MVGLSRLPGTNRYLGADPDRGHAHRGTTELLAQPWQAYASRTRESFFLGEVEIFENQ